MKKTSLSWGLVLLLVVLSQAFAAYIKPEGDFPPGSISFNSADARQVLDIYKALCGRELVISSHVNSVAAKVTFQPEVTLTKSEALRLFEKALLDQAGIVITKLDDKRASVTYNDALPLTVVTNGKPVPRPIRPDGTPVPPPAFPLPPPTPIQK